MGDRKPKKTSSGNSDSHKAEQAKHASTRDATPPKGLDKKGKDKK